MLIVPEQRLKTLINISKTYAILGSVYRGPVDDFHKITKIVQVVAA